MSRKLDRDTRHISLARALHARLYVNCTGRIFAVGAEVKRDRLEIALARCEVIPKLVEAPTPHQLGCTVCDGELTAELLHSIGRALQRWRKELAFEMQLRPSRRRRKAQLMHEHEEIERLTSRLALVRYWQAEHAAGQELPGAPYFLDEIATAELQRALAEAKIAWPAGSVIAWQARVVYWLAGNCAARRFLAAASGLLEVSPGFSYREVVQRFQQAVKLLKKRSELEATRHLKSELAFQVKRLPSTIVCRGKFTSKLRELSFAEHCDLLLQRCAELLPKLERYPTNAIPAAFAAMAATDGSAVAIPVGYLQAGVEPNNVPLLAKRIAKVADLIGEPGYDALLTALGQLDEEDREIEPYQLRELLDQGNKLDDAVWACKQKLFYDLEYSSLKVAAFRRLNEAFDARGLPLSNSQLSILIQRVRRHEYLKLIHAWLAWLGAVSPQTLTPRIRVSLQSTFWNIYLPSLPVPDWAAQLAACLTLPRRAKDDMDCAPFLERIRACQQLAGKQVTLPKTIRKLMNGDESRRLECEHLRERLAQGLLNDGARRRLEYLENTAERPLDGAKLRRTAEEVYLLFGTEALRAVSHKCAQETCRANLGEIVDKIPHDQHLNAAIWIGKMGEQDRNRLRAMIDVQAQHGQDYKRQLVENQAWLAKAALRGLDLEPWCAPEPKMETIEGVQVEITLVSELHYIFLMGTYFQTCLSLGSINEMAVLANAFDANKQVVYMFADDGRGERRLVARQLIAISSEFELVNYCCYLSHTRDMRMKYQEILAAMSAYCGRLAAKCGLKLANQGSPEQIVDHFWYNDGELEWSDVARAAWAECVAASEVLESAAC